MTAVKRFGQGLNFLNIGTRLLWNNKSLRLWALLPFLVDLLLLGAGAYWGAGAIDVWASRAVGLMFGPDDGWLFEMLYYPLWIIMWAVFLVVLIYFVVLCATVIASPFNALLAEKVLILEGALEDRPFQPGRWIWISVRMFVISLVRTVIFAIIGVIIFILSFFPIINLGASFLAFLIIALDSSDYSMEVMELSLTERFKYLKNHFAEFSGMAVVLGVTLIVPGLTLLLLPSSVAGSAYLMAKSKRESHRENTRKNP